MGSTRQDAWNHDEDLLLAEVVLRHIREGGTQLGAFEEVGKKLSRTSAACGFRWNSLIRKKYEAAITIAKKQRKQIQQERSQMANHEVKVNSNQEQSYPEHDLVTVDQTNHSLSLDDVIVYLQKLKHSEGTKKHIETENYQLKEDNNELREENKQLQQQLQNIREDYENVSEDYKIMLNFMERARKMAMKDGDSDSSQVKFQMDYNGNLQKIEK